MALPLGLARLTNLDLETDKLDNRLVAIALKEVPQVRPSKMDPLNKQPITLITKCIGDQLYFPGSDINEKPNIANALR